MPDFLASTAAKAIGLLLLALAIVGFVLWLKWDDSAQPKQDARSANATAETAKQTAEIVIGRAEADASVDDLVAETARRIDALPPPEAARAARNAICAMPEYKESKQCAI